MWIECANDATERIYVDDVTDEPVEFSDNGKANVTAKVGKQLVRRIDGISESSESVAVKSDEQDESDNQEESED